MEGNEKDPPNELGTVVPYQGSLTRGSSTPPGYRNLRVLVPSDLHGRLRNLANQSAMTFHQYILAWLAEAIPLNHPSVSPSDLRGTDSYQSGQAIGQAVLRGQTALPEGTQNSVSEADLRFSHSPTLPEPSSGPLPTNRNGAGSSEDQGLAQSPPEEATHG
jgi:hypothetical protein